MSNARDLGNAGRGINLDSLNNVVLGLSAFSSGTGMLRGQTMVTQLIYLSM